MTLTFLIGCPERDAVDAINFSQIRPREKKRTVHILLTEKQIQELGMKSLGMNCGHQMVESVLECYVEPEIS